MSIQSIHDAKQYAPTAKQFELLKYQHPVNFEHVNHDNIIDKGILDNAAIVIIPVISNPSCKRTSLLVSQCTFAEKLDIPSLHSQLENNLAQEGDLLFSSNKQKNLNVLFIHAGPFANDEGYISLNQFKSMVQRAAVALKKTSYNKVFYPLPALSLVRKNSFGNITNTINMDEVIKSFIKDFCYGLEDNSHKTEKLSAKLNTCYFIDHDEEPGEVTCAIKEGLDEYNGERITRLFVDVRASTCTPEWSQKMIEKISEIYGLKFQCYKGSYLSERNIGGLDDVGRGSQHESYLAILQYQAPKSIRTGKSIVWINKWLTFDQGGLQNKPDSYEMWTDMAGGAAGLGAIISIAKKQTLKDDLYAIFPICENMVSSNSMFPGDPITYTAKRDGKEHTLTVEVAHTDAEGRLVMLSGHAWAASNIKDIRLAINIATLTGGAQYCSGENRFPFFASSENLTNQTTQACWAQGEEVQPQFADYSQVGLLQSDFADIANSPRKRGPSCMLGYLFMKKGVDTFYPKDTPHVHFDIAPTAYKHNPIKGRSEATGSGKTALEALTYAF